MGSSTDFLVHGLPVPFCPRAQRQTSRIIAFWRLGGPESSPDPGDLRELWAPWAPAPVKEGAFVNSAGRLDTCAGAGEPWEGISCNPSIYRQQQGETQVPSPFSPPSAVALNGKGTRAIRKARGYNTLTSFSRCCSQLHKKVPKRQL